MATSRSYSPPWRRGLGYVVLAAFALLFLGPFLIQLATSFKTDADAAGNALSLVPDPVSVRAWERIFGFSADSGVPFGRWLANSTIVATCITLGRVFLDSLAGYALARLRFRGRKLVFWLILGVLSVPNVVLLIPRFLVLKELSLYNTYTGMILPIMVDAAGIFIMRQFFLQVPVSVEEAARIDGAGVFRTYWAIVLPMVRPGILTVTILAFQGSWNEFSFFLVATSDPKYETLTTGLARFSSGSRGAGTQYPVTLGAALLSTIPIAILFFLFQRQFVGGRLSGGVKG
ncbi:carbohydrate ABC transporter permease [Amycolatopsis sp. H20-H5]|uniref:carbohydrate ABC transporter permease n=1 Tax=Amycolatopsis sp. H20-H5 TaxID=3046309 RepID=UPI002DB7A78C|nr:carbohydrate ABC transporter permease [Amycolatopsis sp. H20-H5]MEC3979200.1 carbohydrate ABC transporter permease [Amycolatopsis sp. H20-H5]